MIFNSSASATATISPGTSSTNRESNDKSGSSNLGDVIVGVFVGGVTLLAVALAIGIFVFRKRNKSSKPDFEMNDGPSSNNVPSSSRQTKSDRDWEIPFNELEFGRELGRGRLDCDQADYGRRVWSCVQVQMEKHRLRC